MKKNNNLELITIEVMITREVFRKDDFHIYVGMYQKENEFPEEISIQTSGFELFDGNKKLNGFFTNKFKGRDVFKCFSEEIDINDSDTQLDILCQVKGLGFAKSCAIQEALNEAKLNITIFKNENDWINIPKITGLGDKTREKFFPEIKKMLLKLDNNDILQKLKIMFTGKLNNTKIVLLSNLLNCEFGNMDEETKKEINITDLELDKNNKTLNPLYKQPYKILVDILECSFAQADKLATEILKIDISNQERLIYLSENLLKNEVLNSGSSYTTLENFENVLKENNFVEDLNKFINNNGKIINKDNKIFPKKLYYYEKLIAENIKYFYELKENNSVDRIEKLIENFEKMNNIKYDNSQKEAIKKCVNEGISIITGGAGCGKTTVLKCIMHVLKNCGYEFELCAPTGKASVRMKEATQHNASTLHSFYYQNNSSLALGKIDKTFLDENKCLVIDEVSMCDIEITSKILSLAKTLDYQKVILIGDPFQLPSVGAGNVLKNIIDSKKINISFLNTIHRQNNNNSIIDLSLNIRNQNETNFDFLNNQLYCQKAKTPEEYIKYILKFYNYLKNKNEYKNNLDEFYNEVQIIIPVKKGDVGVNKINEIIKEKYNPGIFETNKIKYTFNIDDKIMCIKNKKKSNVFNGDVGRVIKMDNSGFEIYFHSTGKIIKFEHGERNDFILAYCCTVHKLQGSEYKFVVMVLNNNSPIIDSCLLYTGITRAKKTCIIISNKELMNKVIAKKNLLNRNTMLVERLEEEFGGKNNVK